MPTNSSIFKEIAENYGIKDHKTVYHQAKRFYTRHGLLNVKNATQEDEFDLNDFDSDQTFSINIGHDTFLQDYIDSKEYMRGARSFLRQMVFQLTKFPCNWRFSHLKFLSGVLVAQANCTECKGGLSITSDDDRKKLRISTSNIRPNTEHLKKTHTTGDHKHQIEAILKANTPYVSRALLANKLMDDGDGEPA